MVSGVERSVLLIATNWRDIRPTVGRKHILMLGHCLRCFPNISPTISPGILGIFRGKVGKNNIKLKISGVVQMVILNDL